MIEFGAFTNTVMNVNILYNEVFPTYVNNYKLIIPYTLQFFIIF
jgi:hypothetical protein